MDRPNRPLPKANRNGARTWGVWFLSTVPAADSLRGYSADTFRRDLFAGATVAAVAIPQAMAYASIFGMPVQHGLYTAIVMTAVGALLDSSKQLINGPTNAISIAMLSALAGIPEESRVPAAILMAALIGSLQTAITLLRLGDLSRYISHAVIVGFTAGASVLLVLDQLKNALGLKAIGDVHDHFIKRFWLTMTQGGQVHVQTLIVTLVTIGIALLLRALNKRYRLGLPELLIAMAAAGLLVNQLGWAQSGVKLVEPVPQGLPSFKLPDFNWSRSVDLMGSATAIGLLGLLEAIAMAKSIAAKTGQKLDINQQCLSEGLANLAGSFFQCFPGSGSLTRSYINHAAGAATQWSGVICAGFVAAALVGLAPLAQYVPRAALAGVLLMAASRMIDIRGVLYHARTSRSDALIVFATAASAVLVSIEYCILIGTFLSFVIYVPRAARVEMQELVLSAEGVVRERVSTDASCPKLKIYDFEGELFFGSAPEFEGQLESIEADLTPECRVLVLRVKHLRNPDAVCMKLLASFAQRIRARSIELCLSGVRDPFFETLGRSGVLEIVGEQHVFRETPDIWSSTTAAIRWGYDRLGESRCDACPRRGQREAASESWHFII